MRQEADGTITMRPAADTGLFEYPSSLEPLPREGWLPGIADEDLLPLDDEPFA